MLSAQFYIERPRTHFTKGGGLQKGLIVEMIDKPDVDKLLRCVLDACTGIVYVDDCQVVTCVATKQYQRPAGMNLMIQEVA